MVACLGAVIFRLSLELADLSVHPDESDAARRTEERTRGNAQRAPPPTGNTTVFDGAHQDCLHVVHRA